MRKRARYSKGRGSLGRVAFFFFSVQRTSAWHAQSVEYATMSAPELHLTIHMAASLEAFIARADGRVDWLETSDAFEGGETLVNEQLRPKFRSIWLVGGGAVAGECLRRRLADDMRYSILPVLTGDGIPFFAKLDRHVLLHPIEVKAYKSGIVDLRNELLKSSASRETAHANV